MFASSSLPRRSANRDGTYNVFCSQCSEFIAASAIRIDRAVCIVCQKAEEGIQLTPEVLEQYERSKVSSTGLLVNASGIPPEEIDFKAMGLKTKSKLSSVVDGMLRAFGNFKLGNNSDPTKAENKKVLPSVALSRAKRQPRLFSGITLGSMESVDKEVKDKK